LEIKAKNWFSGKVSKIKNRKSEDDYGETKQNKVSQLKHRIQQWFSEKKASFKK
jgi:hypothetical protein